MNGKISNFYRTIGSKLWLDALTDKEFSLLMSDIMPVLLEYVQSRAKMPAAESSKDCPNWHMQRCSYCDVTGACYYESTNAQASRDILDSAYRKLFEWAAESETGGTMSEWISVKDRLPGKQKWVLVTTFEDDICQACIIGEYDGRPNWNVVPHSGNWFKSTNSVTHWQPLPEPPRIEPDWLFYTQKMSSGKYIVALSETGQKNRAISPFPVEKNAAQSVADALNKLWAEVFCK